MVSAATSRPDGPGCCSRHELLSTVASVGTLSVVLLVLFFLAMGLLCAGNYNRPMHARPRLWRRLRPLSTQILLLQVAIIVLTVSAGFAVSIVQARSKIDEQAGQESLAIARDS